MKDQEKSNSTSEKKVLGTVAKAINILRQFTYDTPEWQLTKLAEKMEMPKTTLLGMMVTLETYGLIHKTDNQTYTLGLDLFELSYNARASLPILHRALPLMEAIQLQTGCFVYLTIPKKGQVFYLDGVYPGTRNISYSVSGKVLPMHCTACGKAMLFSMKEEEVDRIISYYGLKRFTPNTITDPAELKKQLQQFKKQGYATETGEKTIDIKCVGVPVMGRNRVRGALSIASPFINMPDERIPEFASLLSRTAYILAECEDQFPECPMLPDEF